MTETSTNWVTLLAGNDRSSGTSADRTEGQKELIWKVTLPQSVRSSPVLRDGVLYVTCRDGQLYALDSRTGRTRWTFQASAAIRSTPSLSGPSRPLWLRRWRGVRGRSNGGTASVEGRRRRTGLDVAGRAE